MQQQRITKGSAVILM